MNKIPYELAQELKAAGFPQGVTNGSSYYDRHGIFHACHWQDSPMPTEWVYMPSLSELVEAIGKKFTSLKQVREHWEAAAVPAENQRWVRCSSPSFTEATARLWIKMNQEDGPSMP